MKNLKKQKNNYSIYIHVFPNGKQYVGQTSQEPHKRWANGRGYKGQPVWNAINKYGWENVKHEIVMTGLSKEEANDLEEFLIGKFRCDEIEHGYNIQKGGDGTSKRLHNSAEHNRKIALSHMKQVDCYNKRGERVATFESVNAAADFVGGSFRVVSACCNGHKKSGYGYVWRFKGEPFDQYQTENRVPGVKGVPVIVSLADGVIIGTYRTAKEAAERTGVNHGAIIQICKKKRGPSKGLYFDYASEEGTNEND